MDIYMSKLLVLLFLTVCRLSSGLCPLLISKKFKRKYGLDRVSKSWVERSVSYSMDFSGGLLLATCFIHMIPEVREHLANVLKEDYRFPYAETLVCAGFFIVFAIEESVRHVAMQKSSHQLLNKADALISAKINETGTAIDDGMRSRDDGDRETCPMSVDMGGENTTNGISGISGSGCVANVGGNASVGSKFILEVNSMMKDELGECNNNTKNHHAHSLKNILLVSALSFHSVMEGLAIGLAVEVQDVWYLFFAVTVHECTILLCVGIELVTSCPSVITVVVYMAIFALVSPAGVFFGMLLTWSMAIPGSSPFQSIVVNSLQGLAAGTILYVTFFEVLNNHKHHHDHHHQHHGKTHQSKSSLPQLIFILLGFLFMVLLELIGGHEDSHLHSMECHSHEHHNNSTLTTH